MPQSTGAKLRAIRQAKGVSLNATAKVFGLTPSYLSKVERDKEKPSADTIARFCIEFDVPKIEYDALLLGMGIVPADVMKILQDNPALCEKIRRQKW